MSSRFPQEALLSAHAHCAIHRAEVEASQSCGCFYCCEVYPPAEISEWIEDAFRDGRRGETALCPRCGIDSVLGDKSGLPITDADFLKAMNRYFF